MTDLTKRFLAPVLASTLLLTGCGGDGSHDNHDNHDGHDHEDHAEAAGHDHGSEGGHSHSHDHGVGHGLGEIKIADSVLEVSMGGEPGPNATLHIDIEIKSGPTPAAMRVWVGDESATGSVKAKATGSDGRYHADATCPAELTDSAALWIEVQPADGSRAAKPLKLEGHDE